MIWIEWDRPAVVANYLFHPWLPQKALAHARRLGLLCREQVELLEQDKPQSMQIVKRLETQLICRPRPTYYRTSGKVNHRERLASLKKLF